MIKSALCRRPKRRRSVFEYFSSLPHFCTFYWSIPTWNEILQKLASSSFSRFLGGVCNPTSTKNLFQNSLWESPPSVLSADIRKLYTCIYLVAFSAGLNSLQVDELNRDYANWSSRQTQVHCQRTHLRIHYRTAILFQDWTASVPSNLWCISWSVSSVLWIFLNGFYVHYWESVHSLVNASTFLRPSPGPVCCIHTADSHKLSIRLHAIVLSVGLHVYIRSSNRPSK